MPDFGTVIEAVTKIGFPSAVAMYLLLYVTQIITRCLKRIEEKTDRVEEKADKILEKFKKETDEAWAQTDRV